MDLHRLRDTTLQLLINVVDNVVEIKRRGLSFPLFIDEKDLVYFDKLTCFELRVEILNVLRKRKITLTIRMDKSGSFDNWVDFCPNNERTQLGHLGDSRPKPEFKYFVVDFKRHLLPFYRVDWAEVICQHGAKRDLVFIDLVVWWVDVVKSLNF